jgi:hypothetical protein
MRRNAIGVALLVVALVLVECGAKVAPAPVCTGGADPGLVLRVDPLPSDQPFPAC